APEPVKPAPATESPGSEEREARGAITVPGPTTIPRPVPASAGAERETLVARGLRWLERHQHTGEGGWGGPGATGIALLCFLGAGETHMDGSHKETVKNACRHLRDL